MAGNLSANVQGSPSVASLSRSPAESLGHDGSPARRPLTSTPKIFHNRVRPIFGGLSPPAYEAQCHLIAYCYPFLRRSRSSSCLAAESETRPRTRLSDGRPRLLRNDPAHSGKHTVGKSGTPAPFCNCSLCTSIQANSGCISRTGTDSRARSALRNRNTGSAVRGSPLWETRYHRASQIEPILASAELR